MINGMTTIEPQTATGFAWKPDAATVERSNLFRFLNAQGIASPDELLQRSQDDPAWFWDAMVKHLGIEFERPYSRVLDDTDPAFPKWFVGGTLNLANDCVFKHARGRLATHTAIVWEGEDEGQRRLTYADLKRDVAMLADALAKLGIEPGDRVGIYLPMVPEVVVALYACAAMGAIAVPVFSGFAAEAIASRLGHCEAKAIICADGTLRRGRQVPMKQTVDAAVELTPSIEHVIVWRRLGIEVPMRDGRDIYWHDAVAGTDASRQPTMVDSETPFMLAYTSGTTGEPKAAVHVHGGFLVKIAEEAHFQTDLTQRDVMHWVTDMGWIMGPWECVGTHAGGGTLVLLEGAPDYPDPSRLWKLVEQHGITILGVSPTLIRAMRQQGDAYVTDHDLSSLRVFASSGEPWNPEPWHWLLDVVGEGRAPIINLSGGTEVGACFLSPTPLTPLKPASLGKPCFGMSMEVRDPITGEPLGPGGGVGELVCTKPWPAMTRGFWGEHGRERYLETYWSAWPGVWKHGDWASIDEDGMWFLHGRSDDTINVAGKRIGPAEYESIAVDHESVAEAAAVGVPHALKGEEVWIFCVMAPGKRASDRLRIVIQEMAADRLGKAFKPGQVLFVKALPKTRSAKIVRRAVKAAALGEDPGDISSVENPESLRALARAVEQQVAIDDRPVLENA
ncbi:MAG: acyl-CoA synthetase/AMP-acid ligase [Thermoleophilia bacterium]|nr:acyl-CoA synthetase/AMP-acid ligase [Thermoleophilia bacterium]